MSTGAHGERLPRDRRARAAPVRRGTRARSRRSRSGAAQPRQTPKPHAIGFSSDDPARQAALRGDAARSRAIIGVGPARVDAAPSAPDERVRRAGRSRARASPRAAVLGRDRELDAARGEVGLAHQVAARCARRAAPHAHAARVQPRARARRPTRCRCRPRRSRARAPGGGIGERRAERADHADARRPARASASSAVPRPCTLNRISSCGSPPSAARVR